MNFDEFKKKEQELKDINLEMILLEKQVNELREIQIDLFRMLKTEARSLKIKVEDGQFII